MMLKLTAIDGEPVYFNPDAIEIVRPTAGRSSSVAKAAVVTAFCEEFVRESVEDVIKKLG